MSLKSVPYEPPPQPYSFCGKEAHEVACMVAGPVAAICNECVALAIDVCAMKGVKTAPTGKSDG